MDNSDRKKLEILLNYWIDHNKEHGDEFREWAGKVKEIKEVAAYNGLVAAAQHMDKANESLLEALEVLKQRKP